MSDNTLTIRPLIELECFKNLDEQLLWEVAEFWDELAGDSPKAIAVVIWGEYNIPQVWSLDTLAERQAFLRFQRHPGKSELVGRYQRPSEIGPKKVGRPRRIEGDKLDAFISMVAQDIEFVMEKRLTKTSRFAPHKTPVPHDLTWGEWVEYYNTHQEYAA